MYVIMITRLNISEQIASHICEDIFNGTYPPGSKLPSERDMAQRFGTNRNTLREAIRRLEAVNLLSVRQGEGITIRDFRKSGEISLLPLFLKTSLNVSERIGALEDVLLFRKIILCEAVKRAAQNATRDDVDRLGLIIDHIESQMTNLPEAVRLDLTLYEAMVLTGKGLVMNWLFNTFVSIYQGARDAILTLWVFPPNYIASLRKIVHAIQNHQAEEAYQLLQDHLVRGDQIILERLYNINMNMSLNRNDRRI
jgi:GntR family transcriptional repressor for pyruvate dehydrogenase complex